MKQKKTTFSFKLPSDLEKQMHEKLVADGYGLRGKSQWISDAIIFFLSREEEFCVDTVDIADELESLDKTVSFRPSLDIEQLLDEWVITIRMKLPKLEGVKSKIIRAAICQGLLQQTFR